MKKIMILMLAVFMASCEKANIVNNVDEVTPTENLVKTKKFTFTCKGDFGNPTFTRASYLSSNEESLTDLWILDYMNGTLVQQLHQTNTDNNWGSPTMLLAYGSHQIYFVASKGVSATLNTELHKIVWGNPKDTYWKDYNVEVVNTSNGNRAVTLERVATKLKITANDEVPSVIKNVKITPSVWYYGLDYISGEATDEKSEERVVAVPESYIGTSGNLTISIFGISPSSDWSTNIQIDATNTNNETIGHAVISNAPFKRSRSTEYSGNLFRSGGDMQISIESEWSVPYIGEW